MTVEKSGKLRCFLIPSLNFQHIHCERKAGSSRWRCLCPPKVLIPEQSIDAESSHARVGLLRLARVFVFRRCVALVSPRLRFHGLSWNCEAHITSLSADVSLLWRAVLQKDQSSHLGWYSVKDRYDGASVANIVLRAPARSGCKIKRLIADIRSFRHFTPNRTATPDSAE